MEHNNKINWHYTDTEGNPKEPGNYMVTILYKAPNLEYWKNKGFAGKTVAEITKRHFGLYKKKARFSPAPVAGTYVYIKTPSKTASPGMQTSISATNAETTKHSGTWTTIRSLSPNGV